MALDQATKEEIDRLLDKWFTEAVRLAYKPLGEGTFATALRKEDATEDEIKLLNLTKFGDHAHLKLASLIEQYQDGNYLAGNEIADEVVGKLSTSINDYNRTRDIIAKAVMEALGQIEEARIQWAAGNSEFQPVRPSLFTRDVIGVAPAKAVSSGLIAGPSPSSQPTLHERVSQYLAHDKSRPKQTLKNHKNLAADLNLLVEALGADLPVASVTRKVAGKFFEDLRCLPPRFRSHGSLQGLTFPEIAERAQALGLSRMHPRTVNSYLSSYRMFFKHEEMIGNVSENPFVHIHEKIRTKGTEKGYTRDEISKILRDRLFLGSKSNERPHQSGDLLITDWRFWIIIIALTTGARLAEICQLRPTDIRQSLSGRFI